MKARNLAKHLPCPQIEICCSFRATNAEKLKSLEVWLFRKQDKEKNLFYFIKVKRSAKPIKLFSSSAFKHLPKR